MSHEKCADYKHGYLVNDKKQKFKAHLATADGAALCGADNSQPVKQSLTWHRELPLGRQICKTCEHKRSLPETKPRKKTKAKFYSTWDWAVIRYDIIKLYGPVCMCCGRENNITVDHIKPLKHFPELALNPDNLQVLCGLCNRGKSDHDMTDWRTDEQKKVCFIQFGEEGDQGKVLGRLYEVV